MSDPESLKERRSVHRSCACGQLCGCAGLRESVQLAVIGTTCPPADPEGFAAAAPPDADAPARRAPPRGGAAPGTFSSPVDHAARGGTRQTSALLD